MSAGRVSADGSYWRGPTLRRHCPGWINNCELIGFIVGIPVMSPCRGGRGGRVGGGGAKGTQPVASRYLVSGRA